MSMIYYSYNFVINIIRDVCMTFVIMHMCYYHDDGY